MNNSLEIKLIILYFLSHIDSSINLTEITTFLVKNNYAEYMQANQYLADLSETGLIDESHNDNKVIYKINDQGKNTLDMFDDSLSISNKEIINNYLDALNNSSNESIHSSFNYSKKENDTFEVECTIQSDSNTIFKINISNIEESKIKSIESNWNTNKLIILNNIKENLL